MVTRTELYVTSISSPFVSKWHGDFIRDATPPVRRLVERGDTCFGSGTEIHLAREIGVILAWHVSQHVALPFEPYRVRVVRICGIAHEAQPVAHFHPVPYRP